MSEIKSFFLNSGERKIFCNIFGTQQRTQTCILIFLPLFEERMWCQRIAFNFACQLAKNGTLAVMWDYYGYGESDGDSENFTLHGCHVDTLRIMEHLNSEYGISVFNLLGIRTGCGVVCHMIEQGLPDVSSLTLWAPIIDLKGFLFNALRSTISTQSYVFKRIVANRNTIIEELVKFGECSRGGYVLNHIDGYRIGKQFYQEVISTDHINLPKNDSISILYLQIVSPSKKNFLEKIKSEQEKSMEGCLNVSYEIISDREFWINSRDYSQTSERVYAMTMEWIRK